MGSIVNKKAFTLAEIIIALAILSVAAVMALSMYTASHDTNKAANDGYFLEIAQVDALEKLQDMLDNGEFIPETFKIESEAGRFTVTTVFEIDECSGAFGKTYYSVRAETNIGGTGNRKIVTRVVMLQQEGLFYAD